MTEIYNEKVQDLLIHPAKRPKEGLKIRESTAYGIYIEGLQKVAVNSFKEIERQMDEGSKNRTIGST